MRRRIGLRCHSGANPAFCSLARQAKLLNWLHGWVAERFKAAVLKYVASRNPGYLVSIHLAEIRRVLVNRARRFILINRVFL
jgi:hypothetical protein